MALVSLPGLPLGPLTVNAALHLGIFWLGIWLARRGPLPSGTLAAVTALAVFVGVQVLSFHLPVHTATVQVVAALLSLSFVVVMNAPGGDGGAPGRLVARLGQLSMPIYLAHTLFTAATRIVLIRFSDSPALHLTLGTLAGLIGPVLLYYGLRRLGATRLAGF
jgi:surface polysaccharide O-acyltransferase-like enzyme